MFLNYIPPNQTKIRHRFTVFVILTAFIWDSIFAFPALAWAKAARGSEAHPTSPISTVHNIQKIDLPRELGTIEARYQGTEPYSVILVQDAHAIPDAQKAISKLISHFNHQYGVNLIATEGASGKLDPTLFRSFPDRGVLQQVFEDSLHRGELSGVAVASVLNEKEADYYGVEDPKVYEETVNVFLAAVKNQSQILPRLERSRQVLTKLKRKHYSSELWTLDQQIEAFEKGQTDMTAFLEKLKNLSKNKPFFSPERFPLLAALFTELGEKKPADFAALQSEIRKLIETVKKRPMTRERAKKVYRLLQDYQTERIPVEILAHQLLEHVKDKETSFQVSDLLNRQIEQRLFLEKTRGQDFFDELHRFLDELKEEWLRSKEEKVLDQKSRQSFLLEKLARLDLTRHQWEEIKHLLLPAGRQGWAEHFRFYRLAEERDPIFTKNLLRLMHSTHQKTVLFVAGGFHTEGLTGIFKQQGISYLLVSPRMETVPKETHYLDYMQGRVSWEKYFHIRDGRIDLYEAFSQFAADKLVSGHPSLAGPWRESLVRKLAAENRLAETPQYARFIDRALFMSMDPGKQASMKKEWFKKVDRFISELRHLKKEERLTAENVMRIASGHTAQIWTANPFVHTRYPSEWLQHDTPSLPSRSEVRIAQPVFPWKLRAAGPFLRGFYEKMVRSKIPIEIEGWENLPPDGKFILVANHFSLFDGLIIAFEIYLRTGNLVRFIAKPKFLDFFQNLLIWLGAAIKVEYGRTTKKVEEALQQHWSVGFFPGRRVAPDPAFAFKGWKNTFSELSIKYKRPIIPIAISGNMPGTILDLHAIQDPASQLRFKIRIGRPISWESAGTDKDVSALEEETKKAIGFLLTGETIGLVDGEGRLVRGGKFTGKEEQESDRGEENELVDHPARSEVRGRPSFSLNGHTSDDIRKLIDSVNRERERAYLEAAKRQPAIVVYGSARVPEDHRYYKLGVDLGEKLWDYSRKTGLPLPPRTGAGMSLMDAPLKGYRKARGERKKTPLNLTQGVRIELPFEAEISPNIEVGNGEIKPYKYFLIRKTSLHENSLGAIALPGGYGTLDEVFESWRRHRPLVLLDEEFWTPIINAYYNAFENAGFTKKITNRPLITSSIDTAIKYILEESEKNPPFKPDRTRLAAIKEEFETSLLKLYSMPRSVVFVGRPDPVGNGKELKIAVGLADYLTTRYKVPVRLASRGPLLQRFHKKSIAHQWGNLMQAVLRVPENLPLEVEERIIKKNGQTVIVRDQSNSQFLTSSNAYAYVFLPGMQGTQNRLMDLATLIQTGKAEKKPILLIGREFYSPILYALADMMLKHPHSYPMISAEDLRLFHVVDSVQEAIEVLTHAGVLELRTAKRSEVRNGDNLQTSGEIVSDELLEMIERHERESSGINPMLYHRLREMNHGWEEKIEGDDLDELVSVLKETLGKFFGPEFIHHGNTWNLSGGAWFFNLRTRRHALKLKVSRKPSSGTKSSRAEGPLKADYVSEWAVEVPEGNLQDYELFLSPPIIQEQLDKNRDLSFFVDSVNGDESGWKDFIRVPVAPFHNSPPVQFVKAIIPPVSEETDPLQIAVEIIFRPDAQTTHQIYARVQNGSGESLEKTRLYRHRGRIYAVWEVPRVRFNGEPNSLKITFGGLSHVADLASASRLLLLSENGENMIRGTTLEPDLYAVSLLRGEGKDWLSRVVSQYKIQFEKDHQPAWMESLDINVPARSETRMKSDDEYYSLYDDTLEEMQTLSGNIGSLTDKIATAKKIKAEWNQLIQTFPIRYEVIKDKAEVLRRNALNIRRKKNISTLEKDLEELDKSLERFDQFLRRYKKPSRSELREDSSEMDEGEPVRSLRNLAIAVSVMEAGARIVRDTDGRKRVIYERNLERAANLLPLLRDKLGAGEVYLYGGLFRPAPSPGIAEQLHQVPDGGEHFLQSRDGKVVVMTHGYHTKQEKIGDWILRDEVGNPFSIMTMDDFNPVLSTAGESAGTPEKSKALFKQFADKAHELGMKVIVDFIPWLAPDAINAENLHWTFHRRLEPWQNQKFRSLSELDKFEFIKELLRERKNYFFAVRIGQGNEEEIVLIRHLQGMGRPNVDEAILNPLEEEVMEYYLRSLRNLIDLGVDKVRVDLGGNLLLWNLGSYVSDFGKNPEAALRLEQREEPWQRILRETLEYARAKKTKFEFIMEAYHPDEQNFMAELATRYEGENDPMEGSVRVYFKEIFSRLLEMRNGSRAQALDENIQEALFVRFHPDPKRRRVKFMVFPSNFDQTPWSAMNFTRDALGLFSVLAYLGEDFNLNVMVMLRDLLGYRGNLPPIPGGDRKPDRSSDLEGENAHPFPTADEIEVLTDPEKLEAAITGSPVAQFMREFSAVVGQNRQTNIQFLDNSNRDRFITLAWKTQSDDWILLAKNLKPRHGQTLSLDFIEFPDEALRGTQGSLGDWRVFDPLSGQTAQPVTEYHEGKLYHRLRGDLIFADRDYKFLVLKNYKNLPIPESLFWGDIETDRENPEGVELHSRSEVRASALAGELESKIHSHLLHIRGLMNRKPWQFYDVDIASRETVVSEIHKGFHSIEAILEQTYRQYRQRTGGHPSGWVDILQKTEKAAYQFVLILTVLDELHSEKFIRLRSSDKPIRELTFGKGTARRLILLGNQNEPSYNVDVISRWQSQDKHEARFEIQILKPSKAVTGSRKTTQAENTLTSLRIDYETRGQASFDFPDSVRDLFKLDHADGFHGRRIKNLKNPVTFTDFVLLLDKKLWVTAPPDSRGLRAEARGLEDLAGAVLQTLYGVQALSLETAQKIVKRSELRFSHFAKVLKTQARNPDYFLQGSGADYSAWLYRSFQSESEYRRAHPGYDQQVRSFVSKTIRNLYHQNKSYLEADSNHRLSFAFGFRAESKDTRRKLLRYIRMIRALKGKFPRQVTGSFRILVRASDLKNPALRGFFKEIGKSGIAKAVGLDSPSTPFAIQDYLRKYKNALVYGVDESALGPYRHRLVRSQVTPQAAIPVAMLLSNRLALIPEMTAEELKKIPSFLPQAVLGFDGNSLYISRFAYKFVTDIKASRMIKVMA